VLGGSSLETSDSSSYSTNDDDIVDMTWKFDSWEKQQVFTQTLKSFWASREGKQKIPQLDLKKCVYVSEDTISPKIEDTPPLRKKSLCHTNSILITRAKTQQQKQKPVTSHIYQFNLSSSEEDPSDERKRHIENSHKFFSDGDLSLNMTVLSQKRKIDNNFWGNLSPRKLHRRVRRQKSINALDI